MGYILSSDNATCEGFKLTDGIIIIVHDAWVDERCYLWLSQVTAQPLLQLKHSKQSMVTIIMNITVSVFLTT